MGNAMEVGNTAISSGKALRIKRRFREENAVTLYRGDCLKLLKNIPTGSVQLIVTSPPYNMGKKYERKEPIERYLAIQRAVIAESIRVAKPGGSICWQVGNHVNGHGQIIPLDILLYPVFSEFESSHNLRLRNRIVWHFEHGLHCSTRFSGRHETILWFTVGDEYKFNLNTVRVPQKYPGKRSYKGPRRGEFSGNPLGKNPGDVWIIPNVKGNHVEKTLHPCQFPIALAETLVLALSGDGDLVVDPFMGVGTSAVAALMHQRRFAGADTIAEYVKTCERRLKALWTGKLRYRRRTQPVYQPKNGTPLTTPPPGFLLRARA